MFLLEVHSDFAEENTGVRGGGTGFKNRYAIGATVEGRNKEIVGKVDRLKK